MKTFRILLVIFCLPLLLMAKEKATESGEKVFKMLDTPRINVKNDEGYIHVNSWDSKDVKLEWTKIAYAKTQREAEKLLKNTEIDIFSSLNSLRVKIIEPERDRSFSFWDLFDPDAWVQFSNSVIVNFKLTVPKEVYLELSADEGDISVANCSGEIDLKADEGDITCENIGGKRIYMDTDEGDISVRNISAELGVGKFTADEGDIELKNAEFRRVSFSVDEGDISCQELVAQVAVFATDEGDVEVSLAKCNFDEIRISTDEGNARLFLPENSSFRCDIKTLDGIIRTDFDLKVERAGDGYRCTDMIGPRPFAKISADLMEGDIHLLKK